MLTGSVIGCGHGGGLSLEGLRNCRDYELLAAADPSAEARRAVANRFTGIRLFADFREMLAECPTNVVCVATPAPGHAPIGRALLEHGVRGLLLEKPLACDVATAEALLDAIRDAQCPTVVPHGMLVLPAAQEIKARIRSGDIGKISSVTVQNSVDLLNAGIHWLVYLIDLFGTDSPSKLSAEFDNTNRVINDGVQVESLGKTHIVLESGIHIDLLSGEKTEPKSDVLPREEQRGALFHVAGSTGFIEFSAWAGSYWIQVNQNDGELIKRPLPAGLTYHELFLQQLAQNIANGTPDYRSADFSLAALRLIESAYQQHENSEWPLGVPASEQALWV